jgi:hypothetical protein
VRESTGNGDMVSKLEAAEYKLEELKSNMVGLGKEAIAAMSAVEAQQQRLTLQRLIALVIVNGTLTKHFLILQVPLFMFTNHSCFGFKVEAERTYHQRVLEILDKLEEEVCMLPALLFEHIYILDCSVGTNFLHSELLKHTEYFVYPFDNYVLIDRWCLSAKKLKHPRLQQLKIIYHHQHHHLMMKLMEHLHPLLLTSQSNLSISSLERYEFFNPELSHLLSFFIKIFSKLLMPRMLVEYENFVL